jgi:hypothetical protein
MVYDEAKICGLNSGSIKTSDTSVSVTPPLGYDNVGGASALVTLICVHYTLRTQSSQSYVISHNRYLKSHNQYVTTQAAPILLSNGKGLRDADVNVYALHPSESDDDDTGVVVGAIVGALAAMLIVYLVYRWYSANGESEAASKKETTVKVRCATPRFLFWFVLLFCFIVYPYMTHTHTTLTQAAYTITRESADASGAADDLRLKASGMVTSSVMIDIEKAGPELASLKTTGNGDFAPSID